MDLKSCAGCEADSCLKPGSGCLQVSSVSLVVWKQSKEPATSFDWMHWHFGETLEMEVALHHHHENLAFGKCLVEDMAGAAVELADQDTFEGSAIVRPVISVDQDTVMTAVVSDQEMAGGEM